jgi:hypothetical protein
VTLSDRADSAIQCAVHGRQSSHCRGLHLSFPSPVCGRCGVLQNEDLSKRPLEYSRIMAGPWSRSLFLLLFAPVGVSQYALQEGANIRASGRRRSVRDERTEPVIFSQGSRLSPMRPEDSPRSKS